MRQGGRLRLVALLAWLAAPVYAETHVVTIDRMSYHLSASEVRVGDTIKWINKDPVLHTATSDAGDFDVILGAGETARTALTSAGRLDVICSYHPGMRMVLVVN